MSDDLFTRISKRLKDRPWYEKPRLFAMGDLLEIRNRLREKNVFLNAFHPWKKTTAPSE